MKNIIKNRAGLITVLTVASSLALPLTPAAAVPVLFGANIFRLKATETHPISPPARWSLSQVHCCNCNWPTAVR